jgi:hypothetical protein
MKCSTPNLLAGRRVPRSLVAVHLGRAKSGDRRNCMHHVGGPVAVEECSTTHGPLHRLDFSAVSTPADVQLELPKVVQCPQPQDEGLKDGKFRIYSQVCFEAQSHRACSAAVTNANSDLLQKSSVQLAELQQSVYQLLTLDIPNISRRPNAWLLSEGTALQN